MVDFRNRLSGQKRLHTHTAIAPLFGAGLLFVALATQAPAQSYGCIQDGQVVTFDGIASGGSRVPDASTSAWVLNLPRPICVLRRVPFAPGTIREEISAIRIIGTPPPLGVPLALTGKLLLGRAAPDATMFVALEVIRGHKMAAAESIPPSRSGPPPPSVSPPRAAPPPH